GKLVVKIIEAKGLNITSQFASPYVVCTCDSSEFITNGPSLSSNTSSLNSSTTLDSKNLPININKSEPSTPFQAPARPGTKRQYSNLKLPTSTINPKNPTWKDEAMFDIFSNDTHLKIAIYDASNKDNFLGHLDFTPNLRNGNKCDKWYALQSHLSSPNDTSGETILGEIRVVTSFERTRNTIMTPDDFEILSLIGKGTFGQVYQVRKTDTKRIYAMKVLSKKVIVQKKEIAHTIDERNILVRSAGADSPFIIGLKFSFQTQTDLYLVTDYMSGGELFWHLQHEGRFGESRAKFYIAELILALEHLHNNDIVYRDLKPENILLDANGHIALCDFGLSKADLSADNTTNTFCGTTEYLAPEVLLDDQGYTKMVDFWSLGVLIFEMCCGWSPFYAGDTQQMYKNIAFGKVKFPKDALSQEGRNFVKGLLNRNPKHRLGAIDDARELKAHAFFADINWDNLLKKQIVPPFKPHVTCETDTSNFDPEFTGMSSANFQTGQRNVNDFNGVANASVPLSPGIQAKFKGFTFVDDSAMDGYFSR
ncbi:kinase-like protein, partial [Nadsonia fulvescens var. elongata DSM 6958]